MSKTIQTTKKSRLAEKDGEVSPILPLEIWNLILEELLSRTGMGWIKDINILLRTCKMFNKIICSFAAMFIRRCHNKIIKGGIPLDIAIDYKSTLPVMTDKQVEFSKRLSGYTTYENSYTIHFDFDNGYKRLFLTSVYNLVTLLTGGMAHARVILFFTPHFIIDVRSDFKKRMEKLKDKLRVVSTLERLAFPEEKKKLIGGKTKLENELKLLDVF